MKPQLVWYIIGALWLVIAVALSFFGEWLFIPFLAGACAFVALGFIISKKTKGQLPTQ